MKSEYKSLGILIPSRERGDLLKKLLYSLANGSDSNFLEVIVVSDDCLKTLQLIKEFPLQDKFFKYKALATPKRLYAIEAFNFCLHHCDSYVLSWIADDVLLIRKDWISYLINSFETFFLDGIGLGCTGCPGPGFGITTKKFVEYNDGEMYHQGYRVHYADMEVGIRAVLMGRYIQLPVFSNFKHKGGEGNIPHVGGAEIYEMKLRDKRLYGERFKQKFFLDPEKIKNPKVNEIYKKIEDGVFEWPEKVNIPF